ncbi:hypothetical protein [Undibacterium sp. Ren11W]|uniref:hypothetical protein n=1 Tax=Undibacterium sp. Ren11W TaxID=3413045 RepID=UPI003BF0713E
MKAIVLASIAAIFVQPLCFLVVFFVPTLFNGADILSMDVLRMSLFASVIATPFVILVGIPSLLILRRLNRLSSFIFAVIGFVVSSAAVALLGWPGFTYSGYSSGGNWHGRYVHFVVDGVTTTYGWLNYIEGVLMFGLHGLVGAIVLHFVWRCSIEGNNSFMLLPFRGAA